MAGKLLRPAQVTVSDGQHDSGDTGDNGGDKDAANGSTDDTAE
jgi:hypothetical protein